MRCVGNGGERYHSILNSMLGKLFYFPIKGTSIIYAFPLGHWSSDTVESKWAASCKKRGQLETRDIWSSTGTVMYCILLYMYIIQQY